MGRPARRHTMPEHNEALHGDTHDMHDADAHFDGDVHDPDKFPENWAAPSTLDAPPPRAGMEQRWVRVDLVGKADVQNFQMQSRQGWRPRTFESVPAGMRSKFPSAKMGRFGTVMRSGDLVLCEMPKKVYDQMKAYYQAKREGQVQSLVADNIASQNARAKEGSGFGPIEMTRRTKVSVRSPIAAEDV